jgi:hypothetical protein
VRDGSLKLESPGLTVEVATGQDPDVLSVYLSCELQLLVYTTCA